MQELSRLFEVDNSAIYTPKWSKEMQGLAHLPDNQEFKGAMKHSSKIFTLKSIEILLLL